MMGTSVQCTTCIFQVQLQVGWIFAASRERARKTEGCMTTEGPKVQGKHMCAARWLAPPPRCGFKGT